MPIPLPKIGTSASLSQTFSKDAVHAFAELSGDRNPVHLDEAFAADTPFGRPIVHGIFLSSLFSSLLAEKVPGPGTIYLSQSLRFRRPVFVGDTVSASVEVTSVDAERRRVTLATQVTTEDGTVCVVGDAEVLVPDAA